MKETIVLNLETGHYHGLNPSAGRMLELLKEHGEATGVVDAISTEFDVSSDRVGADLESLIQDLLSRGLLAVEDER